MEKIPSLPVATALRQSLKQYNLVTFRHDFQSAFVVSMVALPLSMALSIAVGLPPQHGLYTAIVAGIIVPLLGGSRWQVSGPTAAFVVILAPIVSSLGLRGIIWSGILAGIILIGMGFARLGRLINYIPYPVTTGFTAGIAVVLATLSINDFMGLGIEKLEGEYIEKVSTLASHISSFDPYTFIVGALTLFLLFTAGRVIRFVPAAITAILAGTLLALLFNATGHEIATIGSKFSFSASDGHVVHGIPSYPPILHLPTLAPGQLFSLPSLDEFRQLMFPAFAIAILAAVESLLSATVADGMAGTKHDPNAELTGIGVGNIVSALAAGIPATGALARTATNVNNNAKTPLASSMHAIFIMMYVLLLAPYISYIPMAALAALLIHTAYGMSHYKQFIRTLQLAQRGDIIVLLLCFTLTVFIDMVAGVGIGMICAAFLLINRVAELTQIEVENNHDSQNADTSAENSGTRKLKLPEGTMLYKIRGPLFFGTIEKAFDRYKFTHDYIDTFIIDITDVPFIDMTGLVALKTMLISIAHEDRAVHIVSNTSRLTNKIKRKISNHHIEQYIHFFNTVEEAISSTTPPPTSPPSGDLDPVTDKQLPGDIPGTLKLPGNRA